MRSRLERLRRRLEAILRPADPAPVDLVLYGRADCPLCDELKHVLARVRWSAPVRVEERDVDADPRTRERYGDSIPVLELAGRPLAKGRAEPAELERRFRRRLAELRPGPPTR